MHFSALAVIPAHVRHFNLTNSCTESPSLWRVGKGREGMQLHKHQSWIESERRKLKKEGVNANETKGRSDEREGKKDKGEREGATERGNQRLCLSIHSTE